MAHRTQVEIVDDLDGKSEAQPLHFYSPITGDKIAIDLGDANAERLEKALAQAEKKLKQFIESGRKAKKSSRKSSINSKRIRAWAKSQGMDVSERGRLPKEVVDAFNSSR